MTSIEEVKKYDYCYQQGIMGERIRILEIIEELNEKYPSQTFGDIGVKWNEELKKAVEK